MSWLLIVISVHHGITRFASTTVQQDLTVLGHFQTKAECDAAASRLAKYSTTSNKFYCVN